MVSGKRNYRAAVTLTPIIYAVLQRYLVLGVGPRSHDGLIRPAGAAGAAGATG